MKKLLLLIIASAILFGCNKQENKVEEEKLSGKLEIVDPWIRPAAEGMNTAFFFKVINGTDTDDTLFAAESNLPTVTEVHETYMTDGNMGMRHVEKVIIKSGETKIFKPRDLHVMLVKLKQDVSIGEKHEVNLNFGRAGQISTTATVRDMKK